VWLPGRRAVLERNHSQLEDVSPQLAAQASPLRAMDVDNESVVVPEQSQTRDKAERETCEGEGCLSGPDDGHNTGKYQIV
jgi:hypothetical protein